MFDIREFESMNLEDKYEAMVSAVKGITSSNDGVVSKLANASALINALVGDLNWCGFYLDNGSFLELGPFQGMPACTRIEYDKGVCGKSYTTGEAIRVDDVEQFPGHIACDAASKSELVIPLIKEGQKLGVLDMDSARLARFGELEEKYLILAGRIISENVF